tara:strand:- start:93 stop:323 length:231 start_codon:yes stop_codon:yes gene_type:complete
MGALAPPISHEDVIIMVMPYMIKTSEHYNDRINEVEVQVMEIKESLEVLKYNIKEISDVISYELDRLHTLIRETSN